MARAKRPKQNDATYCRLKGWGPGTVLTVQSCWGIRETNYTSRYLITAVGDAAILVRELWDHYRPGCQPGPEIKWVRKLLDKVVIGSKKPPAESAPEAPHD